MPREPVLELRNVVRGYDEGGQRREVLSGVDLTVATGEWVAFLGRSGSGKSTLLNLISGIDLPDSGEILLEGRPVHSLSEKERTLLRRRRVGFIFQSFNLIPTLTVAENVLLPVELTGNHAEQRAFALGLLDEVGLADRRDTSPDRLSGGEQQRVAIVRALAHDPAVVLADEPTGNLDDETGEAVIALLDRLTRARGKTLLMVTHDPVLAARADRAFRVSGGHLLRGAR
ncbi:MAG: ABC transporter ATP-binding protein [Myxococcota bacterium]|nr:ABC transporter ATP-binding protein [Myxococcota bacterium]